MRPLGANELDGAQATIHACWSSIGVRGDKSCPALQQHVHCRNCPTYAAAASTLLNREATLSREVETEHFAQPRETGRPKDRSAIMFRIGSEWLALALSAVDEVVELGELHSLPHRRSPLVLGLVNVRGQLLVCVSLARLLGIATDAEEDAGNPRRLLVLRGPGGRLAARVDEVQHTHRYHEGELLPPPATITRSGTTFSRGAIALDDRLFASLDETRLLNALTRSLA
jgi:chemotaxis signal transduction protein